MPHRDKPVIAPVVFIGPVGVGKSTVAELLADRLGWRNVSMDDVCDTYYAEIGFDQAESDRRRRTDGIRAAYHYWKRFEAYAVERILVDHQDAVIDLGEDTRSRRTRHSLLGSAPPWLWSATSCYCCQVLIRRSRYGS